MSDGTINRREFLQYGSTAGALSTVVALAGCSGNGDEQGGDGEDITITLTQFPSKRRGSARRAAKPG